MEDKSKPGEGFKIVVSSPIFDELGLCNESENEICSFIRMPNAILIARFLARFAMMFFGPDYNLLRRLEQEERKTYRWGSSLKGNSKIKDCTQAYLGI